MSWVKRTVARLHTLLLRLWVEPPTTPSWRMSGHWGSSSTSWSMLRCPLMTPTWRNCSRTNSLGNGISVVELRTFLPQPSRNWYETFWNRILPNELPWTAFLRTIGFVGTVIANLRLPLPTTTERNPWLPYCLFPATQITYSSDRLSVSSKLTSKSHTNAVNILIESFTR